MGRPCQATPWHYQIQVDVLILDKKREIGYLNYLNEEVWWFHIFIHLKLIDIFNLLFASKRLNEVVNHYKRFKDHRILAKTFIDTYKLNECFMNHFDKLIIRLKCQFTFNTMLYLRYSRNRWNVSFLFQICWLNYSFAIDL